MPHQPGERCALDTKRTVPVEGTSVTKRPLGVLKTVLIPRRSEQGLIGAFPHDRPTDGVAGIQVLIIFRKFQRVHWVLLVFCAGCAAGSNIDTPALQCLLQGVAAIPVEGFLGGDHSGLICWDVVCHPPQNAQG